MVQFECDFCIFQKLRGESSQTLNSDKVLLAAIRRINIDTFWSRTTNTVNRNRAKVEDGLKLSQQFGVVGPYV